MSAPVRPDFTFEPLRSQKLLHGNLIDAASYDVIFSRVLWQIGPINTKQTTKARVDTAKIIALKASPPKIASPLRHSIQATDRVVA